MSYADPDAQREYQRNWLAERRENFFRGKSCVECGSSDRLELDHINPSSKVSHNIWSWSADRRDVEIAKCQILCERCHKAKTFGIDVPNIRGYVPRDHAYWRGCRCDECRADHAQGAKEWRAAQKKVCATAGS